MCVCSVPIHTHLPTKGAERSIPEVLGLSPQTPVGSASLTPSCPLTAELRGSGQTLKVNPGCETGSSPAVMLLPLGFAQGSTQPPGIPSRPSGADVSAAGERPGCRLSPAAPTRFPAHSRTSVTGSHCPRSRRNCPGMPLILKRCQFAFSVLFLEGKL